MALKQPCDSSPPPSNFPTKSCRYYKATCHEYQKTQFCLGDLDDALYDMKTKMKSIVNDLGKVLTKHECNDKEIEEELKSFIITAKVDYKAHVQNRRTPSAMEDHFKHRVLSN